MEKKSIKIEHSGETNTFELIPSGDGSSLSADTMVYAQGRSCCVMKAQDADGNICLIKQFIRTDPQEIKKTSEVGDIIADQHHHEERTYIPDDKFIGTDADDPDIYYQVFRFHPKVAFERLVPFRWEETTDINDLRQRILTLLTAFRGLLSHTALIHDHGYLHCDITFSNLLVFQPNDQPVIQLIDWDSAITVNELIGKDQEAIFEYMMSRSSGYTTLGNKPYKLFREEEISQYAAALNFKQDPSYFFTFDTTALAKLLCCLLFDETTFVPNELTKRYEKNFFDSYCLLSKFFANALTSSWGERFRSCHDMMVSLQNAIDELSPPVRESAAYVKLTGEEGGEKAIETKLGQLCFDILPHIQFWGKTYVQQDTRSPLEQLMELTLDKEKALFLYGEGGAGKSTSAKYFYYSTLSASNPKRLVLYFSLSDKGFDWIRERVENPFGKDRALQVSSLGKPIMILDALDESKLATGNPLAYKDFYELLYKNRDRYRFVVISRNIPEAFKETNKAQSKEKDISFSDVFAAGRFLELNDEQLRGFLEKNRISLEDIEQTSGTELIETLRLPMMLRLFVQIVENASKQEKEEALKIRNEVELIQLYFQKLFREDEESPYYDKEYRKGERYADLYDNEDYTVNKFKEECEAIAEATFFCKPVDLLPRTKRIFNSIVTLSNDNILETRCCKFAKKLYNEKFKSYSKDARQKYLEDIQNAGFAFEDHTQLNIFEKIFKYLSDCVNETSKAPCETVKEKKNSEKNKGVGKFVTGSKRTILYYEIYESWHSDEIKSTIKNSIESFYMPIDDSVNVFDTLDFSHKCFRDYFRSLALARQFEKLFENLKKDHKVDKNRIKNDVYLRSERERKFFPGMIHFYAYFDSEDYQTIKEFFSSLKSCLILSPNEWKFAGIHLGLSGERELAQERVKEFEYLYKCYFGHFALGSIEFGVMDDIYHMICMTYKYFQVDPFEPSVHTPMVSLFPKFNENYWLYGEGEEVIKEPWFSKKTFTVGETHGSRYAMSYSIPHGVDHVKSFDYCPDITEVILGEDVTMVDPHAFDRCPSLKKIDISKNNHFISKDGVVFCVENGYPIWPQPLPDEITVPGEIQTIRNAFTMSRIYDLYDRVIYGKNIFDKDSPYKNAKKLVFSEGVQEISYNVFKNCNNLSHVVLPESLTTLSESIHFCDCPNLKYLTVYNNIFTLLTSNMLRYSSVDYSFDYSCTFAPSVTTLYYMGTSREWRTAVKPEGFFTKFFPNLREVVCFRDGVTLTRRGWPTMMS